MGERAGRNGPAIVGLLLLAASGPGVAQPVDPWMPETLPGFLQVMELAIARSLTPHERAALSRGTNEELRVSHPELHEKISRSFSHWTAEWLRNTEPELERVPQQRIRRAREAAAEVDGRLRSYFRERGWSYRPLRVVFLPRRLMEEPGAPSLTTQGLFLPYYPEVCFATLDPEATLHHTLIHESLHFNKTGPGLGPTLAEGIVESAAARLALAWGLVTQGALHEANSYAKERGTVEYIVERMTEQSGMPAGEALDLLLHTYLTGDSTGMERLLGAAAWSEVVAASRGFKNVRRTARRVLG
jgi:hypothetical protein